MIRKFCAGIAMIFFATGFPFLPSVLAVPQTSEAELSPVARSHYQQGFSLVATAKNSKNSQIRQEMLNNAINEFTLTIKDAPTFADAYSNRAVAYMQQNKMNKAEEDLKKAIELNPKNPFARYNLASLYSLTKKVDLALDQLDASLANGFDRYDELRNDPDLANVRKDPEFRKVLEKHKVFVMK